MKYNITAHKAITTTDGGIYSILIYGKTKNYIGFYHETTQKFSLLSNAHWSLRTYFKSDTFKRRIRKEILTIHNIENEI